MPSGGSLHDTWDTRGELPVRRPTCSCCGARAPYADPDTNAPLCGPCFRAAGHHRAPSSAVASPSGPAAATTSPHPCSVNLLTQPRASGTDGEPRGGGGPSHDTETEMPAKKICARPGCGRVAALPDLAGVEVRGA